MMKSNDHKHIRSRNKKRPTYVETRPQLEDLRTLSQWFLTIPVVMLLLFSCGQVGILTSRKIAEADIQTIIQADYGPWAYVLIHSIRPEIINEIVRDRPKEEGEGATIPEKRESENPWLNSPPKPTSVALLEPTFTITPIPPIENQPLPTETLVPLVTPTQVPQVSPSPTATQPPPTIAPSPTPTFTTAPPTPSPPPATSTNTPVSTVSYTYWFASDPVLDGYALTEIQPSGPSVERSNYFRFYTEPFPEGTTINSGRCTLSFYATNNSNNNQQIGIVVSIGTSGWPTLGGTTQNIPANTTTPTVFTKTFSILPHDFSQADRLTLAFSLTPFVTLHWDGEWNDAGMVLPPISP